MRSLEVSQDFPDAFYPNRGIFVKQAIDAVYRAGVDVVVVSPRAKAIPIKGFPNYHFSKIPIIEERDYTIHHPRYIYPVPKRFLYRFAGPSYGFHAGEYILDNIKKTDVIHAHFPYPDGYGMLKVKERWGVPLVVHERGGYIYATGKAYPSIRKMHMETLEKADRIVAVSHDTRNEYITLGVPEEKIEVVPNGVNLDRFYPMEKSEARSALGLPEDRPIVLFAGYLRPRKGVQHLIEAVPKLVREYNALFVLLGEGGMRHELEEKLRKYHLEGDVMLKGTIPHDQMPFYENAMDVLILPSLAEGRPNVVLEAMACGKPVVATSVSGIPELVQDGKTGILIPPSDVEAIKDALSRILTDSELGRRMGREGKKAIVEMNLSWGNYAKNMIRIYEEVDGRR